MLPTPPHPDEDKDRLLRKSQEPAGEFMEEEADEWQEEDPEDSSATDGAERENEDDLVTIATYRTAPEAELVKTALDAEGIESFIADAEMVTMDWLLGVAVGDVKVQVARRDAERAREFIVARRKRHDGGEGPATCLACGAPFPEDAEKCPSCGWSFTE